MKNLYLLVIVFCMSFSAQAQFLNWGIKGGVNYNVNGDIYALDSSDEIIDTFSSNEEVGYHFGILTEIKLPLFLYIRPELIYTHTESSYDFGDDKGKLKMDKLELPVLVGFRVLKIGRFFFGPNFSYIIDTKLSAPESIKNVDYDDFTVSGQVGLGLNFGKIGADIRWETGFTDSQAEFITENIVPDNSDINFGYADTSHSQFILSFYYKFK
ncbi:porin family protein [Lutimonas sp.]|uniref:porin family protein n=1 Tax=Lutimonas sp. TaxID=1872403 RepID=UPI003D9B5E59